MPVFSTSTLVTGGQRRCFQNQEIYSKSEVDTEATSSLSGVRLLPRNTGFRAYDGMD